MPVGGIVVWVGMKPLWLATTRKRLWRVRAPRTTARHATHHGHHNCCVPKASPLTQRSPASQTMRHLARVAPSKIQCTNSNASQAAARHATHGHHNCRVTSPLTALPASQNNETPTTCSAVQHAPNNKSSADRHVRWLKTSTKCSKHTLCINYASQAEARQITVDTVSKLTAKRQHLPDRGRSPRAPPRVHFRPPPSRPAKDDRN